MINTQLHNELMEKDMQKKLINIDILIQKEKRVLLFEKSKSYLLIIALVFLMLLLLIFLFWIFPNKDFSNSNALTQKDIRVECYCTCDKGSTIHTVDPLQKSIQDSNATKKYKLKKPKQNPRRDTYKDGDEYIKEGNNIHKKTWKDGNLIDDITLEESIQESREKHKEDIPQISTPEKGEKR